MSAVVTSRRTPQELGYHLHPEQHSQDSQVGGDRAKPHVHSRLDEEEGGQHGKRDHAEPLLLSAVTGKSSRDGQAQDEGRKHRMALGEAAEIYEYQQRRKGPFDLGLDHAVPVPPEEPGLKPGHDQNDGHRDPKKHQDPRGRSDEEDAQRHGGPEVGDERAGHDQLSQRRIHEARLDKHRVDDGERCCR
jgi:hypothetical protein